MLITDFISKHHLIHVVHDVHVVHIIVSRLCDYFVTPSGCTDSCASSNFLGLFGLSEYTF